LGTKRLAKAATSFLLGLVFLLGGTAVAIGIGSSTLDIQIDSNSPICSDIGKTSEWGADCFCVEGDLSNLQELDCLVESGIVPKSEYESYKKSIFGSEDEVQNQPTLRQCQEVGKSSELDGDCYCVAGTVSDMKEVDCLIASGVVPADSYDAYRRMLGLLPGQDKPESGSDLEQDPSPVEQQESES
jgi:hypothetical protein